MGRLTTLTLASVGELAAVVVCGIHFRHDGPDYAAMMSWAALASITLALLMNAHFRERKLTAQIRMYRIRAARVRSTPYAATHNPTGAGSDRPTFTAVKVEDRGTDGNGNGGS